MDVAFASFVSTLVLAIPLSAIFLNYRTKVAKIRAEAGGDTTPERQGRVRTLEQQVATLQLELADTQDRLHFTERLLNERNEARRPEEVR